MTSCDNSTKSNHQTTNLVFPNFFHEFFSVLDLWKVCFLFQLLKLRKIRENNLVVWCHEQNRSKFQSVPIIGIVHRKYKFIRSNTQSWSTNFIKFAISICFFDQNKTSRIEIIYSQFRYTKTNNKFREKNWIRRLKIGWWDPVCYCLANRQPISKLWIRIRVRLKKIELPGMKYQILPFR